MQCFQGFHHVRQGNELQLFYDGIVPYNVSVSSGCCNVAIGNYPNATNNTAEVIAQLLTEGYQLRLVSDNALQYVLVKQ
jgi:hypothetical protein